MARPNNRFAPHLPKLNVAQNAKLYQVTTRQRFASVEDEHARNTDWPRVALTQGPIDSLRTCSNARTCLFDNRHHRYNN